MSDTFYADMAEINRLAKDMGQIPAELRPQVRVITQKTCADTNRDAQAFAPVDTGNLRNSITYETHETRDGVWGEVGPTASYGAYVEFGTSEHAPAAYMGPALDRNGFAYEQALGQVKAVDL